MINLHVYPSPITNESRIEREVASIGSLGIFDSIEVAGVAQAGLAETEALGDCATVRRFASDAESEGIAVRAAKTLTFGRAVFHYYSKQPLSVINCHSVAALPACIALKRATGARLVYDTHELETETMSARGVRRPVYKMIERRGIRDVDHTFTVTESIEEWYRRTYRLTHTDAVYNFPSRSQSERRFDEHYFRAIYDLPDESVIYLYQGVLGQGRGIETVAQAFREELIPNGVVVFLGYGPLEAAVQYWAASNPRVFFHQAVSPGELASLTAAADVGLAPTIGSQCLSYFLSAPNKIFQYWHAGIPVIASRLPEHERFMSRYHAGILTESDGVSSLTAACRALRDLDPDVIASGITEANRELRWENYSSLFRARYEHLAAGA